MEAGVPSVSYLHEMTRFLGGWWGQGGVFEIPYGCSVPHEMKFLSSIATQRMERGLQGWGAGSMPSRVGWRRHSPFWNKSSGPLPQPELTLVPLVRTCPEFHQACSSHPVGRISEPRLQTDSSPLTRHSRTPGISRGCLGLLESG